MNFIESLQRLRFVVRNVNAGNAFDKGMVANAGPFKRREFFDRQIGVNAIRLSSACLLRSCHCLCRRLWTALRAE